MKSLPLIMLGAGGHASVLLDIIKLAQMNFLGAVVGDLDNEKNQLNIPILGKEDVVKTFSPKDILLVNGVGGAPGDGFRRSLYERFALLGYEFATLIHPSVVIAESVRLGKGVQIMAGAVLQPHVVVGDNVIINTRASIDHASSIEKHVQISPGAIICGDVTIKENTYIGAGASIANGLVIGKNVIIGCGASIVRSIENDKKIIPAALRQMERDLP